MLGIPTVLDRLIQQAIHQILSPIWEGEFSEHSYGFRPGRSAAQAVKAAQGHVNAGKRWVVDLDLEKFFDRVNHDVLMARVARRVNDRRMLALISGYLKSGILAGGVVEARNEGTPQGGPLSPLLSNILLDDLDRELERRGHRFCRYADDCNVYVSSRAAGERVMGTLSRFLKERLRLSVNLAKSAVDRPWNRKFLGFSFHLPAGESDQGGATVGGAVSGQAPATFPRGTWTEPEAVPRGAPTPTARLGRVISASRKRERYLRTSTNGFGGNSAAWNGGSGSARDDGCNGWPPWDWIGKEPDAVPSMAVDRGGMPVHRI